MRFLMTVNGGGAPPDEQLVLPGVHRGLLGHGRRRLDAAHALHRGAAPGPGAGRADAGRISPPGPYVLQAAITACHAQAHAPEETDWARIAALYQALARLTPSPVVELNRAVAVAMTSGPGDGLEIIDGLASQPALAGYHHLPSVRGDLLARLGRHDEAASEFRRAASLTKNIPELTVLLQRAADCAARTQRIPP